MSFLLRKITPNKWQPNINKSPANYTADALTKCTPTTNNTLSVWHSETDDFEDDHVKSLIVGLALTMAKPDKIDVLWLAEDKLYELGLEVQFSIVFNQYDSVIKDHRDIINLDYKSLGMVSEHIVEQFICPKNIHTISRPNLISLVSEWEQREDTFFLDDLNDKWIEAIMKYRKRVSSI